MGGINSGISSSTRSVVLESAYFAPVFIGKTSRRLNLKTEASQRFEKGVDIDGVVPAVNRAASLIASMSDARVAPGLIDCYPLQRPQPQPITLKKSRAKKVIGMSLPAGEMSHLLGRLNFRVVDETDDLLQVVPPTYRYDIHEAIDLIEEVVRLKGYEQIPSSVPKALLTETQTNVQLALLDCIRNVMIGMGFAEVINYSFFGPSLLSDLGFQDKDVRLHPLKLLNPLSSSQSVLRTTIIPSILLNLRDNLNNKISSARLFEIAHVFLRSQGLPQPVESRRIAGIISGLRYEPQWSLPQDEVDFFDAKGCVATLLDALHINAYRYESGSTEPYLHPGRSQTLYIADVRAGSFGEVHPDVRERFDINATAYVFEFDFGVMEKHFTDRQIYMPFSRHPAILRDIALIVDDDLPYDTITDAIKAFKHTLIAGCSVFDCYRGKNIPSGKKSIALRLKFQSPDRTLTDTEVNGIHDMLLDHIARVTGAELRQA